MVRLVWFACCKARARRNPGGHVLTALSNLPKRKSSDDIAWGSVGKDGRYLHKLGRLLSKANDSDRKLILHLAQKMATR